MSHRKEAAREWARSVIRNHIPRTARRFSLAVYVGEASVNAALGMQFDLHPVEGKVVELSGEWILVKIGRGPDFFVVARDLVDQVPDLGAMVRVTPYARRGFDGRRLDAVRETTVATGCVTQAFVLGETKSALPLDHDAIRSSHLRTMVEYIESLEAGDGVRCLSQVLVDAGAYLEPVVAVDPADQDVLVTPPSLKFRIRTAAHDGWLEYRYDRAMDAFDMRLTDAGGNVAKQAEDVYFDDISRITVEWVDDGIWRVAKIEILKPAPRRAAAA